MIAYLKGIIAEVTPTRLVLEVNHIGYEIFISAREASELPGRGEEVKIYTYFNVREDAMQLFGFQSEDDLEMYKLLLNVDDEAGFRISGVAAWDEISICVVMSDEYYLGVRKEDKKQQKVLLCGDGYSTYENKDPLADELLETVGSDELFPGLDEMYIPMIVRDKENTNNN